MRPDVEDMQLGDPTGLRCFGHLEVFSYRDFVSRAREQIKAGKSVGEAASEYRVPAKYKGYTISPNPQFGDAQANTEIVCKEMKK